MGLNWKNIAGIIGNIAPALGTALGGPAGAAIGAVVSAALGTDNTPDAVAAAVQNNPDAALKLKELENTHSEMLKQLQITQEKNQLDAQTQQNSDVNKTMQAEAAANHWPTYSWRPFIGFVFGVALLLELVLCGYIIVSAVYTNHYEILSNVPGIVSAFGLLLGVPLPILGVASYFRGKMQADPSIPTDNRG